MRSEKEAASGAGGSGVGGAGRGSGGKEKPPLPPPPPPPPPPLPPPPASSRGGAAMEIQFRRESPRREVETPPTAVSASGGGGGGSSSGGGGGGGSSKPREEKKTVLSKVVIRRLPPSLTKEQLEEQLHPLPAHDYFEFCTADPSLYPHLYSRAYINFRNPDDILLFRDRFDGYVFIDSKGLEYPAVVEFAPFQKISKKKLKKKDAKAGSIEEDPEYRKFLETYCVEEEKISANPETLLGEIEAKTRELIENSRRKKGRTKEEGIRKETLERRREKKTQRRGKT
ncbi:regulator of nonsense transcripts 3A isoform X4 [Phascolarctos cinereus]